MKQYNNSTNNMDEQAFEDMEMVQNMSDEQLSKLMADEERMSDYELLAGYKEAATRAVGKKPLPQKIWNRVARRTGIANNTSTTLSTKTIWSLLSAAAAIAILIIAFASYRQSFAPESKRPQVATSHVAKNGSMVVCQAIHTPQEVVIYSRGESVRQAAAGNHWGEATFTSTEADFSKVTSNDISAVKTIVIPRGKLYKVTLSDGTEVWLNADSRLSFPAKFTGEKRQVELVGEAYFKVTKDARHPFFVKSGNVYTKVLGTEFNFRSYGNAAPEVALVKGCVQVNDVASNRSVKLAPGQAATIESNKIAVNTINTEYYTQWKEGVFYFDDASLLDILKELGRWYNVGIEIEDTKLANYTLHFIANRDESLEQIVSDLNFFSYLNVSKKGDKLIISSKKVKK